MAKANGFGLQLLAKSSFVDNTAVPKEHFLVETFTVRLNRVALNAWLLSEMDNVREFYATEEEWEAHKAEYKKKRSIVRSQILDALEIDPASGGGNILQVLTDVFSVVHVRKLA